MSGIGNEEISDGRSGNIQSFSNIKNVMKISSKMTNSEILNFTGKTIPVKPL